MDSALLDCKSVRDKPSSIHFHVADVPTYINSELLSRVLVLLVVRCGLVQRHCDMHIVCKVALRFGAQKHRHRHRRYRRASQISGSIYKLHGCTKPVLEYRVVRFSQWTGLGDSDLLCGQSSTAFQLPRGWSLQSKAAIKGSQVQDLWPTRFTGSTGWH